MYAARLDIAQFDPKLHAAVEGERRRQEDHIELIASENYTSPRVLALQGSVLTNKYAEGYPGRRYYGGCEFVDIAEQLAIDRARQLLAPTTPTCSRTPDRRPTPPCIWRCSPQGTPYSG